MSKDLIDIYGEVIDDFLKENEIQMLVSFPEGSMNPEITSSFSYSKLSKSSNESIPIMDLYILMHALKKVITNLYSMQDLMDASKKGEMLDAIFELVKSEIMNEEKK